MKTKENGKKNKCSIQDDKHLAEEVQEYPCLYDKGKKGYEEKMFEEQLSRNLASKKTIFFLDWLGNKIHLTIDVAQRNLISMFTAWKVSKYGVISGQYFPTFGLNTER